jgi:THO complex subunit 2
MHINPSIIENNAKCVLDMRKFMKILRNDKDSDKQNARTLAKICHSSPCVVLNEAIVQIKQFDNMIPMLVGSLNYCTGLSLDIAVFLTLRAISEMQRKALKENEGVVEAWYSNLANFLGSMLKKHYKIDLESIFVYISSRLCSGEDSDLLIIVLLNEVISKMSGYEAIQDLTEHQIQALTGGIALKTEAFRLSDQIRR